MQVLLFPFTDKETEAQRHKETCRDQQRGCAGARICSASLTPKGFKVWAFSRFCSLEIKFLSLAFEPQHKTAQHLSGGGGEWVAHGLGQTEAG